MKTRTKIITSVIAFILSCVIMFTIAVVNPNTNEMVVASTRTVEIANSTVDAQSVLNEFDNAKLTKNGTTTYFEGYKTIGASSFSEVDYISEIDLKEYENCVVKYNVSFDLETNIVTLAASANLPDGSLDIDEIRGEAFINEKGEVDAVMDLDGESILLSEMRAAGMIENCGWLSRLLKSAAVIIPALFSGAVVVVAAIVVVAVMSSEEEKNAESNKAFNANQTEPTDYIYGQDTNGYGDWKYGVKKVRENGCGPIAVYNTMKKVSTRQDFVDVIYEMEKNSGTLLMGCCGADPTHMAEYFDNHDVKNDYYISLSSMQKAMDNMTTNQMAIACYWTNKEFTNAHYVAIEKNSSNKFEVYNWASDATSTDPISILDETFMVGKFIGGYICGDA